MRLSGTSSRPSADELPFRSRYVLTATQTGDQSTSLAFTFVDQIHNGLVCTVSGPLSHFGRLYQTNGQIVCTGENPHPVTVDALHPTGQGVEGYLSGTTGGGCQVSLHFSAVLNVNN